MGAGAAIDDVISADITSAYNLAVANGYTSLGLRMAPFGRASGQAVTFSTFRLTTNNQTSGVPETSTWAMMLAGFGIVGGAMRRRQRTSVSFG